MLYCFFFLFIAVTFAQKRYKIHTIAFYNLENLFDPIDDPNTQDERSPIMAMRYGAEEVYQKKLSNMARVIYDLGRKKSHNFPTLLGVCEVENSKVLRDLLQTAPIDKAHYDFVHSDSPDPRGIDVALLYRKAHFTVLNYKSYTLRLYDVAGFRLYTRDQLIVSGYLEGEKIHVLVNHYPSRRGGKKRSHPNRIKAAVLTRKIVDSLVAIDKQSKIFVMGDFNDNPSNQSVQKYLSAQSTFKGLKEKDLYNPYAQMFEKGHHTLVHWGTFYLFDQILMSQSACPLKRDFTSWQFYQAGVFNPSYLITQKGQYKGYPYRSFSRDTFTGGFSDHYPVYIYLLKKL